MVAQVRCVKVILCVLGLLGLLASSSISDTAAPTLKTTDIDIADIRQTVVKQSGMSATSADIDALGKTYIVLYWKSDKGYVGYNLYRKEASAAKLPTTAINGAKPITSVSTCDQLKAIIPEGSAEWNMLSDAFSSVSTKSAPGESGEDTPGGGSNPGTVHQADMLLADPDKKALSPLATIGKLRPDLVLAAKNPCTVIERGLTETEEAIFDAVATANLKIRLARGLGYIDHNVTPNTTYAYELRGVASDGTETTLAQNVQVKAGHYVLPQPPHNISAAPGDRKVLILWDRNPLASNYVVGRATTPSGTYQQVNSEPILYDILQDLNGTALATPRPGLVDYQRWREDGLPVSHDVVTSGGATISVDGPANDVTYHYKVASVDILGRQGNWSSPPQSATPADVTPPRTPSDFRVDACSSPVGLALSWRKITLDIDGHQELDSTQSYNIYRADNLDALDGAALTPSSTYYVHSLSANPTDPATMTLAWTDTDSSLVPLYGEKDFWYRVQCVDSHGNAGFPSAAVSGRAPDTTPPGSTKITGAEGHADHIRVMWEPNMEPDLGGYQIYVGPCDMGEPYRPKPQDIDPKVGPRVAPCDFSLVGEVLASQAAEMIAETGSIYYDDYSLPPGSPICYAYWVRAFDMARNLYSGTSDYGCPDTGEYVCERLYEETAPPGPIISGLKARSNSVIIEWLSSPIQDLKAFHIYRSEEEDAPPHFVGCVLSDGTVYSGPWTGMKPDCGEIAAEPNPTAVSGSFEDKNVEPNKILWYRVAAVDWLGNESEGADITKLPAISTFTYSKDLPNIPVISPPGDSPPEGCGLLVSWTPEFDPEKHEGFLVFRSTEEAGPYRQVSGVVEHNEFADRAALRGIEYWYRIQTMDNTGKLSEPSEAVPHGY